MKYLRLKAPAGVEKSSTRKIIPRKANLSPDQKLELEGDLKRMLEAWKQGTSTLRSRLRELNDHLEGVTENVQFPWPGASKMTTGLATGMARTLHSTFDRAVFPDQTPFSAKSKNSVEKDKRNELESAVNWLATEHNNLVEELRDSPTPIFRDGTRPIMGEWERKIERAVDYRNYTDAESFQADYPTPESAGISEDKYLDAIVYLSKIDAEVTVEFEYDEIVYDAPRFKAFPLSRYVFFPLHIESQKEATIYGRQFFESIESVKEKMKRGSYDEEVLDEIESAGKTDPDDIWGISRETIEGISSGADKTKRVENYRLVLCKDLDGDRIPERYLLTFEFGSGKILRIERYSLRKNIDCVVLFRFIKRDGRILGVSMCDDGMDGFKMVDSIHRHRQNVRAITDCPAFLVPKSLKEEIDFGSEDSVFRPGVTFYPSDEQMEEGKAPRQLVIQSLSKTQESIDEEQSVVRYIEFKLGPSQGLSGQASIIDPRAPASKHLSQIKQATLRIDDLIREWKRSVPDAIALMNALYYQYGPEKIGYIKDEDEGDPQYKEAIRDLFAMDGMGFALKHNEISLSPEFEMEKIMSMAAIASQNPILLQIKPEILLHLWNDYVSASRVGDPKRLKVPLPKSREDPIQEALRKGNQFDEENPGGPTPNQQGAAAFVLPGALNGKG